MFTLHKIPDLCTAISQWITMLIKNPATLDTIKRFDSLLSDVANYFVDIDVLVVNHVQRSFPIQNLAKLRPDCNRGFIEKNEKSVWLKIISRCVPWAYAHRQISSVPIAPSLCLNLITQNPLRVLIPVLILRMAVKDSYFKKIKWHCYLNFQSCKDLKSSLELW